ncbi:hypothetical protein E2C01_047253 [Portunus trituberculatus]|uniref:Uncharacterized protein n=1 Tax=Portunus trituberculatus TaxID=210409 RepID=A0A5B7G9Z3_PORTR|nr:hypothetical protein [Portunus trituberculatus]
MDAGHRGGRRARWPLALLHTTTQHSTGTLYTPLTLSSCTPSFRYQTISSLLDQVSFSTTISDTLLSSTPTALQPFMHKIRRFQALLSSSDTLLSLNITYRFLLPSPSVIYVLPSDTNPQALIRHPFSHPCPAPLASLLLMASQPPPKTCVCPLHANSRCTSISLASPGILFPIQVHIG